MHWPQWGGLCGPCWKQLGEARTIRDIESERVGRHREAHQALARHDLTPRPDKWVTINGVEYLVAWDGA